MLKILTEASINKGYGHIYRCKTIADELGAQMIVDTSTEELPKPFDKLVQAEWQNIKWVNENLCEDDVVILDSYHTSIEVIERIDDIVDKLVVIDDLIRCDYRNKIILNPNHFGDNLDYDMSNIVLSGTDYLLTRKEFDNKKRISINEEVKNIFVMFGATDMLNVTDKFYDFVLSDEIFKSVKVHLVCKNIEKYKETENLKLYTNLNGEEICSLLMKCDFAITAGGSTVSELIKTTTPFVCIKVASNQDMNVDTLVSKGYGIEFKQENLEVIKEMFCYKLRTSLFENLSLNVCNHNGAYSLRKFLEDYSEK